jgi:hypothetical protein
MLEEAGWRVRHPKRRASGPGGDMVVRRGGLAYTVEVKTASEGRSDRLVPLWSQAYLQAISATENPRSVLVVVAAPKISPRAAEQVLDFAARYAPGAAAGVIDYHGFRLFRGDALEELNSEAPARKSRAQPLAGSHANIFSDLNQWMLKVLLAPELPQKMLSAPRGRYANATQLAAAARASVMSASRLVRQLQHEGFLHESKPHLELVRRGDLFRQWRNAARPRTKEVRLRFLVRGAPGTDLARVAESGDACIALFAAADALGMGFVRGVSPHLYVRRLDTGLISSWKNVVPAGASEAPDLIVREAPAPESVFRGAVKAGRALVSDVLQVWLDVAAHPSRGKEQADLIGRTVLAGVIGSGGDE